MAEVLALERKRALVVLFTTLDPAALGEGLLPVLPSLVARHTVVVAAVHDPALDALAAGAGHAPPTCYTAAAAERGLAELRRVRAALTRYGVQVVDAPAETFASAVADTYLDLKAAGRPREPRFARVTVRSRGAEATHDWRCTSDRYRQTWGEGLAFECGDVAGSPARPDPEHHDVARKRQPDQRAEGELDHDGIGRRRHERLHQAADAQRHGQAERHHHRRPAGPRPAPGSG